MAMCCTFHRAGPSPYTPTHTALAHTLTDTQAGEVFRKRAQTDHKRSHVCTIGTMPEYAHACKAQAKKEQGPSFLAREERERQVPGQEEHGGP